MTYRKGFETQTRETEVDALEIDGEIPNWLDGNLLRTGPAQFEVGDDAYNHWFDGHAMLHSFQFADGRVGYINRFLETESREESKKEGRIVRSEFGTDPCRSIFQRAMQLFSERDGTDNANVNIATYADTFVAMTETPFPIAFDDETLETAGYFEYEDDLEGDMSTAHPLYDAERDAVYNYLTEFGRTSTYRIYRQPSDSRRRETVAEIDVQTPSYIHSFGMTENYIVLVEFPLVMHPLQLLVDDSPLAELLSWEPERGTRFHVVDKHSGEVTGAATTEPFFAFHHVNAWEDENNGELVVDIAAYPDATIVEDLYLDRLRDARAGVLAGQLRRYRLEPDGSELRGRPIGEKGIELPRINYEASAGKFYQHVWANGRTDGADFFDEVVRLDVEDGTSKTWREPGCYPGEPVFVPRPDATEEDDGVVLSIVLDGAEERSFLAVLDAATMDEIGRATVPHHIPFGFHGQYAEESRMEEENRTRGSLVRR